VIFDLDQTPPDIGFPPTRLAETEPNGLLAVGGDLSTTRLLNAYRRGIFPWYNEDQPILWWTPAPRMVLYPDEFHVSRSLRRSMRQRDYSVGVNQAFAAVVEACAGPRAGANGTWLLPPMRAAYRALHAAGHAHSIEVWHQGELVGGLYGVAVGQVFFGESMFSRRDDTSKMALAFLAQLAAGQPYRVVDCQVYNPHLASLGAREISREAFEAILAEAVPAPSRPLPPRAPVPAAQLDAASR
jgi:leucyl/phenylalanyl-tRNA--protein transferase